MHILYTFVTEGLDALKNVPGFTEKDVATTKDTAEKKSSNSNEKGKSKTSTKDKKESDQAKSGSARGRSESSRSRSDRDRGRRSRSRDRRRRSRSRDRRGRSRDRSRRSRSRDRRSSSSKQDPKKTSSSSSTQKPKLSNEKNSNQSGNSGPNQNENLAEILKNLMARQQGDNIIDVAESPSPERSGNLSNAGLTLHDFYLGLSAVWHSVIRADNMKNCSIEYCVMKPLTLCGLSHNFFLIIIIVEPS